MLYRTNSNTPEPIGGFAVSAGDLRRASPLLLPGVFGVSGAGLIAAGFAHAPTSTVVWVVAYLVLVVGSAQLALAIGQMLLVAPAPSITRITFESALFNLGSAAVIAGTISESFPVVLFGTVLFTGALGVFLLTARGAPSDYGVFAYQALIGFLAVSAFVGLYLSATGANA